MLSTPGEIVGSGAGFKSFRAESIRPKRQRFYIRLVGGVELRPIAAMLFRPEEVHARSPVRPTFSGAAPAEFAVQIPDHRFRFNRKHGLIPHLDHHGFPAIEARSVQPYRLPRKEPADRQRFKPSLAEPILPSVDGEAILSGQIVKWGEGDDIVGTRMEPGRIGPSVHRAGSLQ